MGHSISEKGIEPDKEKIEAIKNYPTPVNADEVKRFVAFVSYYRRHIKDLAKIAGPLNALSIKGVAFNWTQECTESFNILREELMSENILDFSRF